MSLKDKPLQRSYAQPYTDEAFVDAFLTAAHNNGIVIYRTERDFFDPRKECSVALHKLAVPRQEEHQTNAEEYFQFLKEHFGLYPFRW
jgi:hypothetical protein